MLPTAFAPAACLLLLTLSLGSLTPSPAASQPTSRVCLPVAQAARIADSLAVLPFVRQEAALWKAGTDSLSRANTLLHVALRSQRNALLNQGLLLANEQQKVMVYRHKARKRGMLNWLLVGGIALVGGFQLSR